MKLKINLPLVSILLFIFSCSTPNEIEQKLSIPSYQLTAIERNDSLILEVEDQTKFYNEILFVQKLELSIFEHMDAIRRHSKRSIKVHMPNRKPDKGNSRRFSFGEAGFLDYFVKKQENKDYHSFLKNWRKRLNEKESGGELDLINTTFNLAVNKGNENQHLFGLNTFEIVYARFENQPNIVKDYNSYLDKMMEEADRANPSMKEELKEAILFLKEETQVLK